jgi:hypothetical protein
MIKVTSPAVEGRIRELRESVDRTCQDLEDTLAAGIEARSFARTFGPMLRATEERQVQIRLLLEEFSGADVTSANNIVAELRLLEAKTEAFHDYLTKLLSFASEAPRPVDQDRLKRSEADFAAGRFRRFETSEELLKGLAGDN